QSASQALELMQRHGIRHLPVVDPTEHLLGVVSDRDLYASKYGGPPAPRGGAVDEVMVRSPYVVSPSTRLDEAAAVMAKRKYGCAVVVDKERVVGILTTIDALRALVELRAKERGEQLV
ncbi:MAG: CBS domain-containing protein, partial [Myxococcota bacterium]